MPRGLFKEVEGLEFKEGLSKVESPILYIHQL